jgi:Na+/phosphate symporter
MTNNGLTEDYNEPAEAEEFENTDADADNVHTVIENSLESIAQVEYNIESLKTIASLRTVDNIEKIQQRLREIAEQIQTINV